MATDFEAWARRLELAHVTRAQLVEFQEGTLGVPARLQVAQHLRRCLICRRAGETLRKERAVRTWTEFVRELNARLSTRLVTGAPWATLTLVSGGRRAKALVTIDEAGALSVEFESRGLELEGTTIDLSAGHWNGLVTLERKGAAKSVYGAARMSTQDRELLPARAVLAIAVHPGADGDSDETLPAAAETAATAWMARLGEAARILRAIWSWRPAGAPLSRMLRASEGRHCYAMYRVEARQGLLRDLTTAWLAWPLVTIAITGVCLWALRTVLPSVDVGMGVLTGVVLSLVGAQVCATVVSPLAVGASGVLLGSAFGVSQGIAAGYFMGSDVLSPDAVGGDPFVAVTGGMTGLSAAVWPESLPSALLLLIPVGLGTAIAGTAWLMGRARREVPEARVSLRRELVGAGVGSLVGAGIALTLGGSEFLQGLGLGRDASFVASFALVGGVCFGLSVWLRTRDRTRTAYFAAAHVAVTTLLGLTLFRADDPAMLLVALTGASAWFHATWFTGAFMVGGRIGSARAASWAAGLEGAVGFTAFVVWRMISGPDTALGQIGALIVSAGIGSP